METFLSRQHHPYVKIKIAHAGDDIHLECLIDTGFAGGLAIPEEVKDEFDFPRIGQQVWELADDSQIELSVYLGQIRLDGKRENIGTIFTKAAEGLVGIEFLKGKKFSLDLKYNKTELTV